jgi:hypothetical protein
MEHAQKQALHVVDMVYNSEMMYKRVMMGDVVVRERKKRRRQKCGRHDSIGMNAGDVKVWRELCSCDASLAKIKSQKKHIY